MEPIVTAFVLLGTSAVAVLVSVRLGRVPGGRPTYLFETGERVDPFGKLAQGGA